MECSVNSRTIIADYVSLLVAMRIRFGSIAEKSMDGRISRRVGPKQGQRSNSHGEAASIASIFSSVGREHSILRFKQ
jgi:hypothetical protein